MGVGQSAMEGLEVNVDFWRGRRVFITGHTGFKGGWLTLWLSSIGAKVTGYALAPSTEPSLFEDARVVEGVDSHIEDIRSFDVLRRAVSAARPEVVFHLAAQPLVRQSYLDPRETYETNVMGTVNLLEAVRSGSSVRAVVVATSDKCYENRGWLWGYREDDAMGGHDPYSSSKGCAELVVSAYRRSFFDPAFITAHRVGVASVRAGNVIGGGDWAPDRLVPDFVRGIETGIPLQVRNPGATRPWQHVLDPLHGYLNLAESLAAGRGDFASAWNFGPPDEGTKPVSWIAERIAAIWGEEARWEVREDKQYHEATLLKLDSSKARTLLGWRPRMELDATLTSLVEWYKARRASRDMRSFTLEQIARYVAKGAAT